MGNSLDRLKDKHANKRKNVVQIDDFCEKITNNAKKLKFNALANQPLAEIMPLSLSVQEKSFFKVIYEQIKKVHPDDYNKYALACANLAKLYAQQERLESEMQGSDVILVDDSGKLYPHPAMKLLQSVQNTIIRNLTSLGFTLGKRSVASKKEEEEVSEFAQFK